MLLLLINWNEDIKIIKKKIEKRENSVDSSRRDSVYIAGVCFAKSITSFRLMKLLRVRLNVRDCREEREKEKY